MKSLAFSGKMSPKAWKGDHQRSSKMFHLTWWLFMAFGDFWWPLMIEYWRDIACTALFMLMATPPLDPAAVKSAPLCLLLAMGGRCSLDHLWTMRGLVWVKWILMVSVHKYNLIDLIGRDKACTALFMLMATPPLDLAPVKSAPPCRCYWLWVGGAALTTSGP